MYSTHTGTRGKSISHRLRRPDGVETPRLGSHPGVTVRLGWVALLGLQTDQGLVGPVPVVVHSSSVPVPGRRRRVGTSGDLGPTVSDGTPCPYLTLHRHPRKSLRVTTNLVWKKGKKRGKVTLGTRNNQDSLRRDKCKRSRGPWVLLGFDPGRDLT